MSEDLKKIHSYLPKLVDQLQEGRVDRREFLRTSTLLGLSATAAYGFAGITQKGLVAPARAQSNATVRISMRVGTLENPATYSWVYDSNVARQVCDYLTRTDSENITHPILLENWEASDDLKTWTLNLKQGVKWSNGDEFVADHAIWNLKRWADPAVGSSVLGLIKGYLMNDEGTELWDPKAIEQVDDYTIRLNCRSAQLAVPEHLFHYPALILHPSENGVFGVGSIGTGAYSMTEYEVGRKVVLKRREGYWGKPAAIETIEFIDNGDDAATEVAALSSGQVHGLYEGSTQQYAALQKMEHVQIHQVGTAQTGVARMQPQHKPWGDARVRKAMRLALDTEKLLQVAHLGLGLPGEHHHVCEVHPEYADVGFMKQDIEGAKALLAEAGHPDGFDTEIFCKGDPEWEPIAVQAMAQMWQQIGVRVKISVLPSTQYWEIWNKPTAPFAFTTWTHRPLGVMALGLAYRTGVPWNESFYSNPEFDALLTKAEGILDVDERRKVMVELENVMLEDGPACIPLWRAWFTAMDKRLKGYEAHPTSYFFCENWSFEEA
ncbi:ABC transporter substrate-binding protein [Rhodospirillaceae bacterium SYSU D60014]|uniref:ABC transporter substrate-binding protein n=1 Tax=Virgifigura deserti TaxID=2268457 RepID=UPI000E674CEC